MMILAVIKNYGHFSIQPMNLWSYRVADIGPYKTGLRTAFLCPGIFSSRETVRGSYRSWTSVSQLYQK